MFTLAQKYHGKLDADDIEVIQEFIYRGIDVNIFDISTCKTFECFELLVASGYEIIKFGQIINTVSGWKLDKLISVVMYLMTNEKIRLNLNLDNHIFYLIDRISESFEDEEGLCKMVAVNFPDAKVDAKTLVRLWRHAEILEPFFNFTSQELVDAYLSQYSASIIQNLSKYCDRDDYLIVAVFQKIFSVGDQETMNFLIEMGYNITPDSFITYFHQSDIRSYDHLKTLGLWDGQTFDWEKITRFEIIQPEKAFKWLQENHCPKHVIEKIAN
jgi:hypothetical protein